jgi:hypothetical protein
MTWSAIVVSRFPVGSSASRKAGSPAMARDRHPLLLAAGELRGHVLHAGAESATAVMATCARSACCLLVSSCRRISIS